jgi:virginiamycin B lyase
MWIQSICIHMTIMHSGVVVIITVSTILFLLAFYVLSITYNNAYDDYVYGQKTDEFLHSSVYNEAYPDHEKPSNVQFVDMPLNISILEHKSNRTNNNHTITDTNTTESSNLTLDSPTAAVSSRQEGFMKGFCGINSTTTGYSDYVKEYQLPEVCEMPLGIAVDSEDNEVWYVSTKRGILGMYDITENKFEQYTIPQWYVRENPTGFSQVWDVKIDSKNDGESDEIWFTDTAQNAIWRFKKSTEQFELYKIPAQSESFGTTYPITINIVTNRSTEEDNEKNGENKSIYFIGTFVPSLWYAHIDELENGTAKGIHEIRLPVEYGFENIDPFYVTSGSFEFDEDRNSAWISMLSYSRKGQILEYDLDSKTFNIFGLPDDLSSPLGIVVGDNSNLNDNNQGNTIELWVTNPGTSFFYNYGISEQEKRKNDNENNNQANRSENTNYDINIQKYTTSMASQRIFGLPFYDNGNETKDNDLRNRYYTLPSWIKKASDGSVWFNQQQGNKISKFDPSEQELVEYWIPSQNNEWGNCKEDRRAGAQNLMGEYPRIENCGIANVLNFALMENTEREEDEEEEEGFIEDADVEEVWFTEWSTNKIGRIDVTKELPFDVEIQESDRDLTVKRGESEKINLVVSMDPKYENDKDGRQISNTELSEYDEVITMTAAGTFTSTGYLGNSSGYFDVPLVSFDKNENEYNDNNIEQEVSFVLTPSKNMIPGEYILMLGAEDKSVSISKAVKVHVI